MASAKVPRKGAFELTILGSGNAFAPARDWSSILLNRKILLDAAPTVLPNLRTLGMDPGAISTVLLSHLHADHTFGLPFLFLDAWFLTERSTALTIVGPPGTRTFVRRLTDMAYPDIDAERRRKLTVTYLELGAGEPFGLENFQLQAIPTAHGELPSYGYRITTGGRTLAYSGDTGMCSGLKDLVRDADVVVLEMSSPKFISKHHLCRSDVEQVRTWCRNDAVVILTHLSEVPPDMKGFNFARDLKTVRV